MSDDIARAVRLSGAHDDDEHDDDNEASEKLIEVDLPRTMPQVRVIAEARSRCVRDRSLCVQLGAFKRGALRRELQEVLEAYSRYNQRTHYAQVRVGCTQESHERAQGMSYVAAMLHLHLHSPYDTFVCLANLLDRDLFQVRTTRAHISC
jgi:hypothetical protein